MSMGKSKPQTMNTQTPGQQLMAQDLYHQIYNNLGHPLDQYSGQIVPNLPQGYNQVQNMLNSYNPSQFAGAQQGAIQQSLSGQPSFQLDPQTTANWYQNSVAAPSMRNFQQNIAPSIDQGFAGTGGLFSTARGFARSNALSNIQAQNSAQLAQQQMSNQGLQAQLADSAASRQLQALSQHVSASPLVDAGAYEQALQPFQQNQQQQAMAQYQEYLRTRPEANQYMQLAQAFLGQPMLASYQQSNPYASLIGAGIGAAGQIGGGVLGGLAAQGGGGQGQMMSNPSAQGFNITDSAGGGASPWASVGGGALSGGSTGAMFGPWGALLGAGIGAGAGYFAGG